MSSRLNYIIVINGVFVQKQKILTLAVAATFTASGVFAHESKKSALQNP